MKTNRIIRLLLPCALGILLAACEQDDIGSDTGTLPEGMYPVEIFAVQEAESGGIQTRVTDPPGETQSQWSDGDKIFVKMYAEDDPNTVIATGEYKYDEEGKFVAEQGKGLYWPEPDKTYNFTGWYYPDKRNNDGNKTYSLSDQTNNLVYMMYGTGTGQYSSTQPLTMNFDHKLAKIRVTLNGVNQNNINDYEVSVKNYSKCSITDANEVIGTGSLQFIPMRKNLEDGSFEANVVPGQYPTGETELFQIKKKTDATNFQVATAKQSDVSFNVGHIHPYDISLGTKWISGIVLSAGQNPTINKDMFIQSPGGNNNITVSNKDGTPITITFDARVEIDNFTQLWQRDPVITIDENTEVILKVPRGEYNIKSYDGAAIVMKDGAKLTIMGDDKESSTLNVTVVLINTHQEYNLALKDNKSYVGIGADFGNNINLKGITIKNIKLKVEYQYDEPIRDDQQYFFSGVYNDAAIGLSHYHGNTSVVQSCDNITIDNADVTVFTADRNGEGACIGTGSFKLSFSNSVAYTIETISISNSKVTANAKDGGACIGFGVMKEEKSHSGTINNITITDTDLYLQTQKDPDAYANAYMVGCGKWLKQEYTNTEMTIGTMSINGTTLPAGSQGWNKE